MATPNVYWGQIKAPVRTVKRMAEQDFPTLYVPVHGYVRETSGACTGTGTGTRTGS
jgi:hypothetical protein